MYSLLSLKIISLICFIPPSLGAMYEVWYIVIGLLTHLYEFFSTLTGPDIIQYFMKPPAALFKEMGNHLSRRFESVREF